MAVTDSRSGRAASGGFHLRRMIERAGKFEIVMAAREHVLPARVTCERGDALHETRGYGRRAGEFLRAGQDDFFCAQRLREVVRGEADAPFRRIEAQLTAHRAREPRVAACLARP